MPSQPSEFDETSSGAPAGDEHAAMGAINRPSRATGTIQSNWQWHGETDALIRAAIESANDAVLITEAAIDLPGPRIEYVNHAFSQMTGYSAEEVLGKTPRILQGPKTDRKLLETLRDDLEAGRVFFGQTTNYRKDGSEYFVEWRITAMRDAQGNVLKWVAIQRDVSERRLVEQQREQLLAAEQAAREEAERVGRMKDEFLATLSHELRTPLNAILGWAGILQRARLKEGEARRALEVIQRNAKSQARLVDDLLDMSRINAGQFKVELRPMRIASAVEAAVQSLAPTADAKAISLEVEIDRSVGAIMGEAARVQQIVWNVVSNAIKFTPAGGLVRVKLERTGNHFVQLKVSDNGIGIEPAFLPNVFDRFLQADASATRRHGGLGLGLAIVKHLAELHGASVDAASDGQNRGATFTVKFPIAAVDGSVESEPDVGQGVFTIADAVNIVGLNVLVVEDDDDARAYFRRLLTDAGATVIEASTGPEALELWGQVAPDVLLSDIGMPEMDGYELIRVLRDRFGASGRPFPPAIAVTAYARPDDRRRARLAGFQSHLAKPIDPKDLLIEIASLCRRM